MSAITEALERRAIELYTDLNTALPSEPDGADKQLMESAFAHLITSSLMLKAPPRSSRPRWPPTR